MISGESPRIEMAVNSAAPARCRPRMKAEYPASFLVLAKHVSCVLDQEIFFIGCLDDTSGPGVWVRLTRPVNAKISEFGFRRRRGSAYPVLLSNDPYRAQEDVRIHAVDERTAHLPRVRHERRLSVVRMCIPTIPGAPGVP
jgi:hypothetical protein